MADLKSTAASLLQLADIDINGSRPWDMQVRDDRLYARALSRGSLGLGEAYMDGWWEVPQLDQFFSRVLRARLHQKIQPWRMLLPFLKARFLNLQSKTRAFEVGRTHYDTGNEFFSHMLDKRMVYTCGYWNDADNLDQAQEAKLDLVCKKIGLKPGMRVLDIGCGWGSFIKFAAENYRVECVGITISKEQAEFARESCRDLPIEVRLCDYRDMDERFDRIVSLGMFEHVGHRNHRVYFETANRCLKDDGLFLLHTIGNKETTYTTDAWIGKYIFPNGNNPSLRLVTNAAEKLFVVEDLHNFGAHYHTTLMAWFENFDRSWPVFKEHYGERFYRMWKYYLMCCAGAFHARDLQLWQFVLSKNGLPGGYTRVGA